MAANTEHVSVVARGVTDGITGSNQSDGTGAKSGGLVRVGRKNLTEVEKLEIHNQRMEQRLEMLREEMSRQKEKRGTTETLWRAAKPSRGTLNNYADDVLAKKNAALKMRRYGGATEQAHAELKKVEAVVQSRLDQLSALQQAKVPPVEPTVSQLEGGTVGPPLSPRPPENARSESLPKPPRMWRVPTSLGVRSQTPEKGLASVPKPSRHDETGAVPTNAKSVDLTAKSPALLDGDYDERESRNSFLQALNEWRAGRQSAEKASSRDSSPRPQSRTGDTSTSTQDSFQLSRNPASLAAAAERQITFHDNTDQRSLTYLDRMLLKQFRASANGTDAEDAEGGRQSLSATSSIKPEVAQRDSDVSDSESDDMEDMFWVPRKSPTDGDGGDSFLQLEQRKANQISSEFGGTDIHAVELVAAEVLESGPDTATEYGGHGASPRAEPLIVEP
ncbi:hypothetical protein DFJ73DRAFT_822952 [Zopfochytrium polystomum]|nr:hypothetical protein DFJ73DRAFT_822952 [Zopfochytrium polystomum]